MQEQFIEKGLLYLVSGCSSFVLLALGLRWLANTRFASRTSQSDSLKWHGIERLVVVERLQESANVISLKLARANQPAFSSFKSGQFLSLFAGDDDSVVRSYSISSTPSEPSTVRISVRAVDGGRGSQWMHQLKVGDSIRSFAPAGHFTDNQLSADDLRVYIAGGIGITPVFSMLKHNLEQGIRAPIYLYYGARTSADLVFHSELEALAQSHSKFKYRWVLSHEVKPSGGGETGFVDLANIFAEVSDVQNAHFFVCGPEPMMNSLIDGLLSRGIGEDRIHSERFVSVTAFKRPAALDAPVSIEIDQAHLQYSGDRTLLEFFDESKIQFPSACRTGVCGSCKCRIEGQVEMLTDSGLTLRERREGLKLACVSFPRGALKVRRV